MNQKQLTPKIQKLQNKITNLLRRKVDQMDDGWRGYIKTTLPSDKKTVFSYIKCCRILDALKKVGELNDNYCSFDHWKMNANGYFKNQPEIEEQVKKRLANNLSRVENALDYTSRRKTIFCAHCTDDLAKEGIVCQWGSNWMWKTQKQVAQEKTEREKWLQELENKSKTKSEQALSNEIEKECWGCGDKFTCLTTENFDYCVNCAINGNRYLPTRSNTQKCPECGDGSGWVKFPNQPARPCKICALRNG